MNGQVNVLNLIAIGSPQFVPSILKKYKGEFTAPDIALACYFYRQDHPGWTARNTRENREELVDFLRTYDVQKLLRNMIAAKEKAHSEAAEESDEGDEFLSPDEAEPAKEINATYEVPQVKFYTAAELAQLLEDENKADLPTPQFWIGKH